MAHEFESGAFARFPAWHGLGEVLPDKMTAAQAMNAGKLNWLVEKRDMYFDSGDGEGMAFPGQFVLVRDSDSQPLGTCSDEYEIDQNIDGFDWLDDLLGEGLTYESVMSLKLGKLVCLLAHMPPQTILGEEHKLYIAATLWHDGQHASSLKFTDQRIVCKNTWNAAMSGAGSFFSYKHTGNLKEKRDRITKTLKMGSDYMDTLAMTAQTLVECKVERQTFVDIVNQVWPIPLDENGKPNETKRQESNRLALLDQFAKALKVDDLRPFRGTAWCIMQAASDFDTHSIPTRETASWKENRFINLMDGKGVQDTFLKAIKKVCAVNV